MKRTLVIFMGCGCLAHATSIEFGYQDTTAAARGNAFAATADNPSAVYYNPAGLAWQDRIALRSNLALVKSNVEYRGPAGAVDSNTGVIPAGSFNAVIPASWAGGSFGIGLNAPHGLAVTYPDNSPLRTLGIEGELAHLTLTAAYSWKVSETFSLGVGLVAGRSELVLEQGIPSTVPGSRLIYEPSGSGFGWTAGAIYRPNEKHSFGVTYRSHIEVDLKGDFFTTGPLPLSATAVIPPTRTTGTNEFEYPEQVVIGYAYRPNRKWLFEVNAQWSDWRGFDTFTITNPAIPALPSVQDYQPGWIFNFGLSRTLSPSLTLNAGYLYGQETVPDRGVTPFVPDGNLHNFSVGLDKTFGDWSCSFAFIYGRRENRSVTGASPNPLGPSANGTYKTEGQNYLFSLTREF